MIFVINVPWWIPLILLGIIGIVALIYWWREIR